MSDAASAADQLEALLAQTIARLDELGIADEALGVMVEPGRITKAFRQRRIDPVGRAWRLGTFLLTRDARLYSTGDVTRAIEPSIASNSRTRLAEARRDDRRAASRGRFPKGEVVNFGFTAIEASPESLERGDGVLSVVESVVMVRWNPLDAGRRPLADYLADRLTLLEEEQRRARGEI